ncbi:ABC transporter [Pochonia chlamydosporia 170]|uniref:ABC transporter n=1 Tax=Pochonia chlamydosporia 170 TaxID=1380566 RepID=A0A179FJT4_METCM|nr:ABC transporter [Pochonia chlamydosporia 170]OAQ65303.1 ABC transporter [Pochonia chlamydosporia 170]
MGKQSDTASPNPSSTSTPSHLTEPPASITLSSSYFPSDHHPPPSHRYFDEDPTEISNDDLPPLYSDHEEFNSVSSAPFDPLLPQATRGDTFETVHSFRHDETSTYFLDPRLDRDPDFLADHIHKLSMIPPRPFVKIVGTHTEKSGDKNKETKTITDFDIEIELTHLLYSDIRTHSAWRSLNTASNFEKVHRGTIFATRAPGFGGSGAIPEEGTPSLREWCRRYCASKATLKSFTMERKVEGYDWDMLRRRLEGLVRATNYRGRVQITFPVRHSHIYVYNECRVNRWRLTRWIAMIFMFTLLFLFTWPALWLSTKRWEVVTAEWRLSEASDVPGRKRYVSLSEEAWYGMWAGTIQRAMLERRRGLLDQGDLERTRAGEGDGEGGLAGVVRAGVEAMGVVNRSFGWGGDSC